jgi:hypothetical protein
MWLSVTHNLQLATLLLYFVRSQLKKKRSLSFEMDIIRRIFHFLGRHPAEARPIALKSSPIGKLPHELILLIASHLPLESTASLSLSCHPLYSCIKMEYLSSLKEAEYWVINGFLRLLERDLPTHILCPHCNKLHSMDFAENHLRRRYGQLGNPWLKCWIADLGSDVKWGIHLEFSSTIFRMAMKAHRQGRETTSLLGLLSH